MMMRLENLSAKKYVVVLCCHTELKDTIFEEIKLFLRGDTGNVDQWKSTRNVDQWKSTRNVYQWIRYVGKFKSTQNFYQWKSRVNNHLTSILENRLPSLLRSKIPKYLVSLVSIQIIKWAIFHEGNFGLSYLFSRDFIKAKHFTDRYIIDRELTAVELVTDTSLDVLVRFKIACFYLITNKINELWYELSSSEKKIVKEDKNKMVVLMSNNICFFESSEFTYDKDRSERFYSDAFIAALQCGSEDAAMQSFNILFPKEEKHFPKTVIKKLANEFHRFNFSSAFGLKYFPRILMPFQPYMEFLIFLYEKLESDDFCDLLNLYGRLSYILYCLLDWPYQDMFLSILEIMWVFIKDYCFHDLLLKIIHKMKDELVCLSYDYKSLFRKFWIDSPSDHKRYVCRIEGVSISALDDDSDSSDDSYGDESQHKKLNHYLIFSYFTLNDLTSYDEETLQLILNGLTGEEKEGVVSLQGVPICKELIKAGNFKLADLFINCCIPVQKFAANFKANLLTPMNFDDIFWNLVSKNEVKLAEDIFNWALPSEEVESVKQKLLELFSLRKVLSHFCMNPSRKESMDNFLSWILGPDEVVEFKRNLMSNMDVFVSRFESSIYDGKFERIDSFLQWIYKSEYEINSFKTNLAFIVVSDPYIIYVKQGIDHIDQFIEWSIVDKIERKEFRFQLAFALSTVDFYSQYIIHRIPCVIDEFISWCQISEDDAREFKKKLMFYEVITLEEEKEVNTFVEYSFLVLNGERKEIDQILKWSELSGDDLKNFRRRIRECCENVIFIGTPILEEKPRREISNVVSWIKSSDEELKEFAKEVMASIQSLKNEFSVIFEKGQQKDIGELVEECQCSEEEMKGCKKLFLINKNSVPLLQKLVSDNKWMDITGILSWIGLSHEEIPIFKRELFKISGTICFQLAIRGKYDDMNVYLTWLEINIIEMNAYVKEKRKGANIFYRLITKNLGKNNKLVKKYLRRKMKYEYQFKEFRLAFYAWVNLYWGNGLCLYCEKTGNFISGEDNWFYCKHCRNKRPSYREVKEIDKIIDQLNQSQNGTFMSLSRS